MQYPKVSVPFILALLATVLSGCASIVNGGSTRAVSLQSTPIGAHVSVTDSRTGAILFDGTTPATATLRRSAGYFRGARYVVKYQLAGYEPQTMMITSNVNGWYFGNLVFGGLIGFLIVDPATGAMYSLPHESAVTLSKADHVASAVEQARDNDLVLLDINQIPDDMRPHLVRVN